MNQEKSPGGGKYLQSVTEDEATDGENFFIGVPMSEILGETNPPNKNAKSGSSKQTRPSYYSGYVPRGTKTASSPRDTLTSNNQTISATNTTSTESMSPETAKMEFIGQIDKPEINNKSELLTAVTYTPTIHPLDKPELTRDTTNNSDLKFMSRQGSLMSFSSSNGADPCDLSSSALAYHSDMLLSPEGKGGVLITLVMCIDHKDRNT